MSSGLIRTAAVSPDALNDQNLVLTLPRLTAPSQAGRWAAALVVLPVFLQAPWVRLHPFSAGAFTVVLLAVAISLGVQQEPSRSRAGGLLLGFSGSWLAGTVFWGWLRAHPAWHLPVEAMALPLALAGLNSRWRLGCAFYLSSLLGTALTDLAMALTGVMHLWPQVLSAPLDQAQPLLHEAAISLQQPGSIAILAVFAALILGLAQALRQHGASKGKGDPSWTVAAAVLVTIVASLVTRRDELDPRVELALEL